MNIREQIEADLYWTLENPNDYGMPVTLVAPDGSSQDLYGQIVYDTTRFDPEIGMDVVVHQPVVTLRRSSLNRIPAPREKWIVKIPVIPSTTAEKSLHSIERAPEDGQSIGFIRLFLTKAIDV